MGSTAFGPRIWLIAGPTASGKSALALRLARAICGEIVNADSMQLYRDLAILTARATPADEALAPHHLYGVADAADAWSAGRWLRAARDTLDQIAGRGRPAIVVGGTGLYFRALTVGLADIPAVPASVRAETGARFDRDGEAEFRRSLAKDDPASEARISPGDRQRLVRAGEVLAATGRPLSAWQGGAACGLPAGSWRAVVIEPPRDELYRRCDARLAAMVDAGALGEVSVLLARHLDPKLPAMKAVGVRELAAAVRGDTPLPVALAKAQQETRRYAKRQLTWFRRQTPDWPRVDAADAEGQWEELKELLASGESRSG
ncbi:MAG TPA: tRNA (adenosine(37)-N6)-dimethylallyltransferase MiaA [Caulobacteraceae bacterium]